TPREDGLRFELDAPRKALEQSWKPGIPLVPVMISRGRVKFEPKMTPSEQVCKFAIRRQQAFLFATGQEKIREDGGVRGLRQHKRIVVSTCLAPGGSKNRAVV